MGREAWGRNRLVTGSESTLDISALVSLARGEPSPMERQRASLQDQESARRAKLAIAVARIAHHLHALHSRRFDVQGHNDVGLLRSRVPRAQSESARPSEKGDHAPLAQYCCRPEPMLRSSSALSCEPNHSVSQDSAATFAACASIRFHAQRFWTVRRCLTRKHRSPLSAFS